MMPARFIGGRIFVFFFFNDTATTEIYTFPTRRSSDLDRRDRRPQRLPDRVLAVQRARPVADRDRKSTRLNSSHVAISYAVFCLKKKNNIIARSYTSNNKKKRKQ